MSRAVLWSRRAFAACASCSAHSEGAFGGNAVHSRSNAFPIAVSSSEKPREMATRRSLFSSWEGYKIMLINDGSVKC